MNDCSKRKLDALGTEAVCEMLAGGVMQREIARKLGIDNWSFIHWAKQPERAEQIRNARAEGAAHWDERAEQVLVEISATTKEGTDAKVVLGRARELAQHYRWRASKLAPAQYGDKVAVEHSGQITTPSLDLTKLTDEQLEQLRAIAQAAEPGKGATIDE